MNNIVNFNKEGKLMNGEIVSWDQIKELAQLAIKNNRDFSFSTDTEGYCSVDIRVHDNYMAAIKDNDMF